MIKLTEKQMSVLRFIKTHTNAEGFPPTHRDIAAIGVRSTNAVSVHLSALERKGWLTRVAAKSRALRFTPRAEAFFAQAAAREATSAALAHEAQR